MFQCDTDGDLQRLAAVIDELSGLRGKGHANAALSAWSVDQHLYHIALATDLAFANVLALVKGDSPRIRREAQPAPLAALLFERDSFPRGQTQAPRMVQPPSDPDVRLLADEQERNKAVLQELRAVAGAIGAADGAIRHQELGDLSAGQWLHFASLHAEHHLMIAREIEASRG